MVVAGMKAKVQDKLSPNVYTPAWKCALCVGTFILCTIGSYAFGAGGGGNPFFFFDYIECFWHAIPFVIAFDIYWASSFWCAVVSVVDVLAPETAVKLVCCSRDMFGKICWFSCVAYLICRILSWILAMIVNPCESFLFTRSMWSGPWMWGSWTFWITLLINLPLGFVTHMIVFPNGQTSQSAGEGTAHYQSMPPEQANRQEQQEQQANGATRC